MQFFGIECKFRPEAVRLNGRSKFLVFSFWLRPATCQRPLAVSQLEARANSTCTNRLMECSMASSGMLRGSTRFN